MGIISPSARPRRGFTLVELLVVLALLAMIAGMAVPRLFGVLSKSRIQQAAQQLAYELNNARSLAITHGCTYELRISSDGTSYAVRPKYAANSAPFGEAEPLANGLGSNGVGPASQSASVSSSIPSQLGGDYNAGANGFSSSDASTSRPRPQPERIEGQLENGVVFGEGKSAESNSEVQIPFALPELDDELPLNDISESGRTSTTAQATASANWERLLDFYPDGRSESTEIKLSDEDGRTIELSVRGLTGAVRINPVKRSTRNQFDPNAGNGNAEPNNFQPSNSTAEVSDAPY